MLSHNKSKHQGIAYFCNEREYKAIRQGHLKAHKGNKHGGHEGVNVTIRQLLLVDSKNWYMKDSNIPVTCGGGFVICRHYGGRLTREPWVLINLGLLPGALSSGMATREGGPPSSTNNHHIV